MVSLQGEDRLTALPTVHPHLSSRIYDNHQCMYSFSQCCSERSSNVFLVVPEPWYKRLGSAIAAAWGEFKLYRLFRVPKRNWLIIIFYAGFLIRLMFLYSVLYVRQRLLTMIITNLLLFGLSDTLAQSLSSLIDFKPDLDSFHIRYVIEKEQPRGLGLSFIGEDSDEEDGDTLVELGLAEDFVFTASNATRPKQRSRADSITSVAPPEQLGYNFRRLLLFMLWGMIQSFAQFFWYSVLNEAYQDDNLFLGALKRVLSDQLCYSPICKYLFFFFPWASEPGLTI